MKRMKTVSVALLEVICMLMMMISYFPLQATVYAADTNDPLIWDGSSDTSWYDDQETELHIRTSSQLAGFASLTNDGKKTFEGKTVYLDADLDMSGNIWENPISDKYNYAFSGTFDGQGHAIYGLNGKGLFYSSKGTIMNIRLINCALKTTSGGDAGICVELESGGLIDSCYVSGSIQSESMYEGTSITTGTTGGICAYSSNATISNCIFSGDVNCTVPKLHYTVADYRVGGICGYAEDSTIDGCGVSIGNISINDLIFNIPDKFYLRNGGICGCTRGGRIYNSYNKADVSIITINSKVKKYQGGIVGYSFGDLVTNNVYNTGNAGTYAIVNDVSPSSLDMTNTYYLSTSADKGSYTNDTAIAKSEENMKKESFAEALGEAFVYKEGDYPALAFESKLGFFLSSRNLSFTKYQESKTLTLSGNVNGDISWISSDTSVAVVEDGTITAVGNGSATIYAVCGEKRAECSVTVSLDYSLSEKEITLDEGDSAQLAVLDGEGTDQTGNFDVAWSSSDENVAVVENGKIITVGGGETIISAKFGSMELLCNVTVISAYVPPEPALNFKSVNIAVDETVQFEILNYDGSVTWVSSNTLCAVISDTGTLTATKEGTTVIYAMLSNGKSLSCNVTIEAGTAIEGDCNGDGEFSLPDVVLLQKWLLAVPDTHLANWKAADLCTDDKLNVFDLVMMKRMLLTK